MLGPESAPGRGFTHGSGEEMPPTVQANDASSLPSAGLSLHASPLLVAAPQSADLCGVSERTWRKLDRAALIPRAVHIGRRRLWLVDELRLWAAAGCPSRERWEALKRTTEARHG